MGTLDGRVALVTGAGQGVGQGIAFALAAEGARVAVTGRTLAKVEASAAEIARRGGEALALACDVKSPADLARSVAATVERFGALNILVNNAQEVPLGSIFSISEEALDAGWVSGPLATLRLMKLCYPHLKGDGCIVNLGSSAAMRWDAAGYGAYAAIKDSIRQFTRWAACEWGPDNIRCNVVLPHALSPALEGWAKARPAEAEEFRSTIPLRRIGHCEDDIGRFVAQLCSPGSSYVTGQSIALDGGQSYLG